MGGSGMKTVCYVLVAFSVVVSASAQNIILKDGRVVATKGVRRAGDTIMATIEMQAPPPSQPAQPGRPTPHPQPPKTGELGFPIAQVAKIDFPEPEQLKAAVGLINSGKADEALKQIEPVLAYYEGFRDAPGSWWADAVMLKMQALMSLGRNDEAERLADQMARNATDPDTVRLAKVYAAAGLARKGQHAQVIQVCDAVLNEATRPQTLAAAAVVKGESCLARREWADALLSLLEVPVFYPRQEVLMPQVLLGAARAYIGLDDFARAKVSLNELGSKFASTPEAAQGKTELERIARLEKSPSPAQQ
jgi:tetratricopeptide (TPR) repeat protein